MAYYDLSNVFAYLFLLSYPLDYRGLVKTEIVTVFFLAYIPQIQHSACHKRLSVSIYCTLSLKSVSYFHSLSQHMVPLSISLHRKKARHHVKFLSLPQSPHLGIHQSINFTFYVFKVSLSLLSIPAATVLTCAHYFLSELCLNPHQSTVTPLPILTFPTCQSEHVTLFSKIL